MIIMYSQNHAIDALATQGATTSATMVLTLLSQNKTCKTQTLVYGTCEHLFFLIFNLVVLNLFTKYKNMFTLSVILTIDIALGIFTTCTARSVYEGGGGGGGGWAWVRCAGAGKKIWILGGGTRKKIRKKRGRGLGGKNWAGAGGLNTWG